MIVQSANQSQLQLDVIANPASELELVHHSNGKNEPINQPITEFVVRQSNAVDDLNQIHYSFDFVTPNTLEPGTYHLIARNIINTTIAEFKVTGKRFDT